MLIEVTRHHESAFTLFGRLRVAGSNRLDLKKLGLMPIFTAARVLSIRHKLHSRSTFDRLTQAQALRVADEAGDLVAEGRI
jgi:signal-transduction protein with cAMP-binding, CBS, and nucleotidyltransferase domain